MGNFASPRYTGKGGAPTREEIKSSEKKDVGITKILTTLEKISEYQESIKDEEQAIENSKARIEIFKQEILDTRDKLKKELSSLDDKTKSLLKSAGIFIDTGNTLDELIDENKSYHDVNRILKNRENKEDR